MRLRGFVAFDLDGTLLRGPTVCELLAAPLGRLEAMRGFETLTSREAVAAAREEMLRWYAGVPRAALLAALEAATWAPGAAAAVALLQRHGVEVGVASITWDFAVEWFARKLGVTCHLGTQWRPDGGVGHVWGPDKGEWLRRTAAGRGLPADRVAAVGDSAGDEELLREAGLRFFVGVRPPPDLAGVVHLPGADLLDVARRILDQWPPGPRAG
jgi:phosphoserine phosphatase